MNKCPYCRSKRLKKLGYYKSKRGKHQRFKCLDCVKTFTNKTFTINWRKRKQHLREKITDNYCERMSLRGIARTLKIDIKMVVKYFRENAEVAKQANKKRIKTKDLMTFYVEFDQMETFEHTKRKPVGIQVSIRHKTGEIVSAKAGYIPIRALAVSKEYSTEWNRKARNSTHILRMLNETKEALNRKGSLVTCDREKKQGKIAQEIYTDPFITIQPNSKEHKRIDRVFRRMRQDLSCLGRRTLSTTKDIKQLQKHLDLYVDYNNIKSVA